ncbi:hypothetical protein P5673_007835 [Acropora cervicornis]|uniref:Uncharacterized protein n=1 Tax=Acropora cervicornis TaxID=6130 RepID=A0AAD9QV51_ACRCE|nr:hypothetical protein P5673_007835 [Acropora cervicornis]
MESLVFAKGAAGQYFTDLVEACEDHFNRIYPECVNSTHHETVMCPPVFPFGYVAPTGQASGAKALTRVEEDTIRGDNAELKIFQLLEKYGQNTKQPMFVLTQLKLSEFSKNVLQQVLPADHPVLSKNFNGEIDFVIIHRRIGVILMEVKSKDKFSKSLQGEARKQVQKGEEIIHALLQADHRTGISIPVYKVIAMPNVADECRGNSDFIGLRGVHVRSDDHFNSWWKSMFVETEFEPEKQQKLQHLISVCVCQKSEVSSAVLASVCKKIATQNFLQKSYKKGMRDPGDRFQEVSRPADNWEQEILARQFLFLNPDQLRIWNGDSHMFFNGSSGSGKTILLQFKALKCAKASGEKVVVVVPLPLIALYKEFFAQNGISSEKIDVLSPVEFFHGSLFRNNDITSQFHFFADELQTFQTKLPDLFTLLETLMARFDASDCYCWIAYDYMQMNEDTISLDETGGICSAANLPLETQKLCDKFLSFQHASCLNTVVRSTLQIYSHLQLFIKKSLKDLFEKVILLEHIDDGTKQSWGRWVRRYEVSNHLGHHICGPSVAEFQDAYLDEVVEIIATEINKWTTQDCLHRVAVLVSTTFLKENLSQLMTMKGISFCDVGPKTNAVVLDYGHKAHSYEWPIVIAVSNDNDNRLCINYIMLTRAITRLVVIKSISTS